MADPFAAMLGIGIDDEQKMQALAERLRGRNQAAEMFTLSGIPQISAGATNEMANVNNSLEQVGGLRKALAQRKQQAVLQEDRQRHDLARYDMERTDQLSDLAEQRGYNEQQAAEERRREEMQGDFQTLVNPDTNDMMRVRWQDGEQIDDRGMPVRNTHGYFPEDEIRARMSGRKPPASIQKSYLDNEMLANQSQNLLNMYDELDEDQKAMANQPVKEMVADAAGVFLPDSVIRGAEETYAYTDPKVREYRSQGLNMESQISKALSGSQVTSFEMKDRKQWSPFAPGISAEERNQRVKQMNEAFRLKNLGITTQYPGWFKESPEYAPEGGGGFEILGVEPE